MLSLTFIAKSVKRILYWYICRKRTIILMDLATVIRVQGQRASSIHLLRVNCNVWDIHMKDHDNSIYDVYSNYHQQQYLLLQQFSPQKHLEKRLLRDGAEKIMLSLFFPFFFLLLSFLLKPSSKLGFYAAFIVRSVIHWWYLNIMGYHNFLLKMSKSELQAVSLDSL